MNALQTLTTICLAYACTFFPATANPSAIVDHQGTPEKVVKERLCKLGSIVSGAYEDEVIPYLKGYFLRGQNASQEMLGRSEMYFPVFEHYLKLYNLPVELKYLPIVESSLRPYVSSSKGAVGLWQFVERTGRRQGLIINGVTDERRDVYQSTKAAARYLAYLYKRFGAWDLAMAAYNCGETKLNRAIGQAGTKDFLVVRQFLPKETSDYVPRFLAAHYLSRFHLAHGLLPVYPDHELLYTGTIKVYAKLSFQEISQATGVATVTIKKLNPSYSTHQLPASEKGNFLILPETAIGPVNDLLREKGQEVPVAERKAGQFNQVIWEVKPGDTIGGLAALCGCRAQDVINWNNLKTEELFYRQKLVIYYPSPTVMQSRA